MVRVNSLLVWGQILVFLLNSRTASTGFPTNGYGDIVFDEVVPERGSKDTGPTEGDFFAHLEWSGGVVRWGGFCWFLKVL